MKLFKLFTFVLLVTLISCGDKDKGCSIEDVLVVLDDNKVTVSSSVRADASIEQYNWKFSDGFSEATFGPSVTHNIVQNGDYTVDLAVDLINGNTCEYSKPFTIASNMTSSDTCDINFVKLKLNLNKLDAEVEIDGSPADVNVWWKFGDGTIVTNGNETISYDYKNEGIYTLQVGYSQSNGCSDSTTRIIKVDSILNSNNCSVSFVATPAITGKKVKLSVVSNVSSSNPSFEWDMGDGKLALKTKISNYGYTYVQSGNYKITVSLVDGDFCTASSSYEITIE